MVGVMVEAQRKAGHSRPFRELVDKKPTILEQDFFKAELADGHDIFKPSNCLLTDGVVFKAPLVLSHPDVKLSNVTKLHNNELAAVQSRKAYHTRFYDICAHDIVRMSEADSEAGRCMLYFLNTLRIAAGNDAVKVSKMPSKLYYYELRIKQEPVRQGSLLKVEKVAADNAASDLVQSVYSAKTAAKANKNNIKSGKQDANKRGWKQSSSGSNNINNKSGDNTSFKKKKQQKLSGNNSNNTGNKSGGGSSGKKHKEPK
ncbi:hypothetical protein BGW39_005305 [Mortierella sp. 14UC]|nr:hypothetical protein BGW39_005305 [Mortierella sp. 14UC]